MATFLFFAAAEPGVIVEPSLAEPGVTEPSLAPDVGVSEADTFLVLLLVLGTGVLGRETTITKVQLERNGAKFLSNEI